MFHSHPTQTTIATTTTLDGDIFTLIYSHISDFEVLHTLVTTVTITRQRPLCDIVLRRLL